MKQFELKRAMMLGWGKVILFVAATAAVWFWLGRMGGGVAWLAVEAPRHAVAGERLPMRVHISGLKDASHLCVDLHWSSVRDASNGYLASGGTKPVGKEGGRFDFEIMIPATKALHFVNGIIYLSPTASWNDHTFVAATDLIPVTSGHDSGEPTMVRLPVRQLLKARVGENTQPTVIPRLMTGFMFLASALVAWLVFRSISNFTETSKPEPRWWLALAVALTLAGIWELLGLENLADAQARAWARAEDVYYSRAVLQKGIISVTIAATLVSLGFVWRKRRPHQLALFFFACYLAISIVNLLSFHSLDHYAGLSWHGVTLVEALKLVCAAAILKAMFHARQ